MHQISQLLEAAQQGDRQAASELLPLVYGELRRLAALRLSHEAPGQTLQPTALVHEAYLRLLGGTPDQSPLYSNQRHFFAAAAEAMRRILVERARAKAALKRGGELKRIDLDVEKIGSEERPEELLALDDALAELAQHDAQAAELVKLRFFAGLTHQQAAESLGLTRRGADRVWALARARLLQHLQS